MRGSDLGKVITVRRGELSKLSADLRPNEGAFHGIRKENDLEVATRSKKDTSPHHSPVQWYKESKTKAEDFRGALFSKGHQVQLVQETKRKPLEKV